MAQINSSGSVERMTLAAGESKTFINVTPGGNQWVLDLHGDDQETGNAVVDLRTSEDGTTFTTVGSAVTVVAGGIAALSGATGAYGQIRNVGPALIHVVAKPFRIVNPVSAL